MHVLVVVPRPTSHREAGRPLSPQVRCRECQRVFEVEACPGNLASLAPPGFTVEDHDLTLYGRCSDCAPAHTARRVALRGR